MARPELSVIIAAKDQEPFVADCCASLRRQFVDRPEALEVIVVDDGSSDATAAIVERYRARLPRLTLLRNAVSVGLASARNLGLEQASGRYVSFLDADDWLAPGHLDHLVARIGQLGVDFVRTDHVQSSAGQRSLHRAPEYRRERGLDPRDSILPSSASTMVDYCYAWAGVFDSRLGEMLRFPAGLFTAEDRPWAWRLHLQAESYAVVGSPGILYRRGIPSSLTQILDHRQLDFLPSFRSVFDLVRNDRDAARFWPKAGRMFLGVLTHHLRRAARMDPADVLRLEQQAVSLISEIPIAVVRHDVATSTPERREILSPYLPANLGRRLRSVAG